MDSNPSRDRPVPVRTLHIDIETYSDVDLPTSGLYRYAESPAFEVLLFAYAEDNAPVTVVDLASGETIPAHILAALSDPSVIKWAFNASFERICLSRYLGLPAGTYLHPLGWCCSMVYAATVGLPITSLKNMSAIMRLTQQKMAEGKGLIERFCKPCKATLSNGGRTRNMPEDDPEGWNTFKAYCVRDVEAEMEIQRRLQVFDLVPGLWETEYVIDQTINDRGIAVHDPLIHSAITLNQQYKEEAIARMQALTGLQNPQSVQQMNRWLREQNVQLPDLTRKTVLSYLDDASPAVREVMELRLATSKSSIRKYEAMLQTECADHRIRGLFKFFGTHTGRWSGHKVQVQNLPQNHIDSLDAVRTMVLAEDTVALSQLEVSIPETISQLIRTAFVAREGCHFIVSDYSAIEARVLAWFAQEQWRLDAFKNGADIYCASASKMFGVPVEKNGVNSELRAKGKIAELALGYGGSVGALQNMGALDYGLEEDELQGLVNTWRGANPNIVQLWRDVDRASIEVTKYGGSIRTHGILFECVNRMLFITLPSGRKLAYIKPLVGINRFGQECVTYRDQNFVPQSDGEEPVRVETYGAKLVENIVQGTARDILSNAMTQLYWQHYDIVLHVHDEVVVEAPMAVTPDIIERIMCTPIPWAAGLPLSAEAFSAAYYQKN